MLYVPRDVIVLSSIGGCCSCKNHPAILSSLLLIPRDSRILYLHAGMETPAREERALAGDLDLTDKVRFLGVVPDILPILHSSDIFLMPSIFEGFGCAAAEAMGAGVPMVLSR